MANDVSLRVTRDDEKMMYYSNPRTLLSQHKLNKHRFTKPVLYNSAIDFLIHSCRK